MNAALSDFIQAVNVPTSTPGVTRTEFRVLQTPPPWLQVAIDRAQNTNNILGGIGGLSGAWLYEKTASNFAAIIAEARANHTPETIIFTQTGGLEGMAAPAAVAPVAIAPAVFEDSAESSSYATEETPQPATPQNLGLNGLGNMAAIAPEISAPVVAPPATAQPAPVLVQVDTAASITGPVAPFTPPAAGAASALPEISFAAPVVSPQFDPEPKIAGFDAQGNRVFHQIDEAGNVVEWTSKNGLAADLHYLTGGNATATNAVQTVSPAAAVVAAARPDLVNNWDNLDDPAYATDPNAAAIKSNFASVDQYLMAEGDPAKKQPDPVVDHARSPNPGTAAGNALTLPLLLGILSAVFK